MAHFVPPRISNIVYVKFPADEGGWSKGQIKKAVAEGSHEAGRGTHWVHFDDEEYLSVVRLVEDRYGSSDDAHYLSWVLLGRTRGRRGGRQ